MQMQSNNNKKQWQLQTKQTANKLVTEKYEVKDTT